MLRPQLAPVRPRVLSANGPVPLDEVIRRHLDAGDRGLIALVGQPGSGRTTALAHLNAVFADEKNLDIYDFVDADVRAEMKKLLSSRLMVYRAPPLHGDDHVDCYLLAAWTDDDLIEYLLARHRDRCKSVMARLRTTPSHRLEGKPELWRIVLDKLAEDESLPDARAALMAYLEPFLADTDLRERSWSACLNALTVKDDAVQPIVAPADFPADLLRVLRHLYVQVLVASGRMAADIRRGADCDFLGLRLWRELIDMTAEHLAGVPEVRERLLELLDTDIWSHAMAASLLHRLGGWRPTGKGYRLKGAYLEGASWSGLHHNGLNLTVADLSGAELSGADLSECFLEGACLANARLEGATLRSVPARQADLSGANLWHTDACKAQFMLANLHGANMDGAQLNDSDLSGADLTAASLRGAVMASADLSTAKIKDADFSNANLDWANLSKLCLREANFSGAQFTGADLQECDLEHLAMPQARFRQAHLAGSLLTGSIMHDADFFGADLSCTGLAEIDWPGADLRHADLTGATFHMGSSRSGLVGSPIPCEGSKTGFYTDEYDEQLYRPPEEVRKANLRGADLTGAKIDGVDFYLVDLRGAKYDVQHREYFKNCGAILETKAGERGM